MQISGSELDGVDDGFDCDMEWVTCACLITLGMQGIMWVLMHGGGCIVWVLTLFPGIIEVAAAGQSPSKTGEGGRLA